MTLPAIRPRFDQIAELSRNLQLPLPEVHTDHLTIIAEGLLQAYDEVRTEYPSVIISGSEAEITAFMESRLNALIDQNLFWRQLVLCVVRGKESLSFDGSHLEKRPDLSIYLTDRNRSFPLITEAKIIDFSSGKNEKLYCENGVQRFLIGDYAWGTREAFMLAYVRDNSSIGTKLTPFLLAAAAKNPPEHSIEEAPVPHGDNTVMDLARSTHSRTFSYTNQAPPANLPGTISLWHLWLSQSN